MAVQTMDQKAFEVLVCDDGSTQPLDAIIDCFRAKLPLVRHLRQPNEGPAAARNLGIEHAASDVVIFLDSDVLPEANVVQALTEALETTLEWQGAEARLIHAGGKTSPVWEGPHSDTGGRFHTAGIAYRRPALLAVGGFDEEFTCAACEDVELAVQIRQLGPIGFVPEAIVQHPRRRRTVASAWKSRRNWRFVQILACRQGFVAWPTNTTRWPRLETALCATMKLPIGRALKALKSFGHSPADAIAALGLAVVDAVAGLTMLPTILFGSVPPRSSRFKRNGDD